MPADLEHLRTALADRYTVQRELGRGGMATVYLADDLKHGRPVAIKVLHPELAATLGAERFLREIEIEAGLNHPHILPLHESGEADSFLYYVMPYVEGESLRDRLDREGPLPVADAVQIAREVASALSYAHEHGVLHRDIKPQNILLSAGEAVVADFGIARAIGVAAGEPLTVTGMSLGTPAYMSPEQATGEGTLDGRSDVYALGCVLYEMLAGEPPFTGPTPQAVLARKVTEIAPPLSHVREIVTPAVEEAVNRALARVPADRYASAAQMADMLRRTSETPAPTMAAHAVAEDVDGAPTQPGTRTGFAVGAAYLVGALSAYWLSMPLSRALSLPQWFPTLAVALFALALPGVLGLAFFRRRRSPLTAARPTRSLTWRNAGLGGAAALGLWGLAAIAWLPGGGGGGAATRAPGLVDSPDSFDPAQVAVLYFVDLGENQEDRYLAAGFTEALIHELTEIEALDVRSTHAVKPFRETNVGVDSIARALRVGSLVEGSLTRSGDRLRVNVVLVDASTGAQLDSKQLERPWGEKLDLLDDVSAEVSEFLRERLGVEIRRRKRRAVTTSERAWDLARRAEKEREDYDSLLRAGNAQAAVAALDRADRLLREAEASDPVWIEPIVERGWVAATRARRVSPTPGIYDMTWTMRGLEHAERALGLQSRDPQALELRGALRYRLWQASSGAQESADLLEEAERDLRAAVAEDPSLASAWNTLSELLQAAKGEFAKAKEAALRAYTEDPYLFLEIEGPDEEQILFRLAQTSLELGQHEEAISWIEEGRRRFPERLGFVAAALLFRASADILEPEVETAWGLVDDIAELALPERLGHYLASARMQFAAVLARAGLPDSARAVIGRARSEAGEEELVWAAYEEAHAWLVLGDRERALGALEIYLEASPEERDYLAMDPWFEDLRDDPRFKRLVATDR